MTNTFHNTPTPFISLFSGAMGLDLGLEMAGFSARVAVENDPDAVRTIRHNKPGLPVVERCITSATGAELIELAGLSGGEIPLVAGGPPCQAFSVIGKRKGLADVRGQMIFEFIRLVGETNPRVFVMENVRGLLSMATRDGGSKGSLLKYIIDEFGSIGFRVDCFVVNAVNYGAPQLRERLILIGNRDGKVAEFPKPRFSNRPEDDLPPFRTLGDAIGNGFIDNDPAALEFSARKLQYLKQVPPGGNWRSLPVDVQKESMGRTWHLKGGRSAYWRRLSFAFPSPTVVTMPNHAGTSMCHPTETRAITVGEAAAIQEFPSDWRFVGSPAAKFRQVGNAVPVRLGSVIGETITKLLAGDCPRSEHQPSNIVHLRPHVRTRTFWKSGTAFSGDTGYYDDRAA